MKKIINLTTILTILMITSCIKQNYKNENVRLPENKGHLTISKEEFQSILFDLKSQEKTPEWWIRLIKFVRSNTGQAQRYIDGIPQCSGNYPCGPCPGICITSITSDLNADSADALISDMSRIKLTVIAKNDSTNDTKMIIEMPISLSNQAVHDNYFNVTTNEELPSYLAQETGFSSIFVDAGNYPIIYDSANSVLRTIVNITVIQ